MRFPFLPLLLCFDARSLFSPSRHFSFHMFFSLCGEIINWHSFQVSNSGWVLDTVIKTLQTLSHFSCSTLPDMRFHFTFRNTGLFHFRPQTPHQLFLQRYNWVQHAVTTNCKMWETRQLRRTTLFNIPTKHYMYCSGLEKWYQENVQALQRTNQSISLLPSHISEWK